MRKCLACGEECNGNRALGKHYKDNPSHRPTYKSRKSLTVMGRPKSLHHQENILDALSNPEVVVNAIDEKLQDYHAQIKDAKAKIATAEEEINRLEVMRKYFVSHVSASEMVG